MIYRLFFLFKPLCSGYGLTDYSAIYQFINHDKCAVHEVGSDLIILTGNFHTKHGFSKKKNVNFLSGVHRYRI